LDVDLEELAQSGVFRPWGETSLACRVAGAAQGGQEQRLSDRKAVIAARGESGAPRPVLPGTTSQDLQVSVYGARDVQLTCEGEEGGDGTMCKGSDREGLRGAEASQEVVGLAEISDHADAGLSIDASRLDDPPVGMTLDAEALEAGHALVYTTLGVVLSRPLPSRYGHLDGR